MVSDDSVGFDGGIRVPSVDFEYPDEPAEASRGAADVELIAQLLDLLNAGGDPEQIGRRCLLAGKILCAPTFDTQAALAEFLGISEGRVSQQIKALRAEILAILRPSVKERR
jgi:hypothetical protein